MRSDFALAKIAGGFAVSLLALGTMAVWIAILDEDIRDALASNSALALAFIALLLKSAFALHRVYASKPTTT